LVFVTKYRRGVLTTGLRDVFTPRGYPGPERQTLRRQVSRQRLEAAR
jgi:hypothetical protein